MRVHSRVVLTDMETASLHLAASRIVIPTQNELGDIEIPATKARLAASGSEELIMEDYFSAKIRRCQSGQVR
jgi:hypothetical protein